MAFSHTWGKNNGDMYFHYGDGSSQDSTTLVGCYGDGTKYGQVLFLDTGDNGGIGFTFKWYPVAFSNGVNWGEGNGVRDVYCRISTGGQYEGCTNSSSNATYMSSLSGGGYGCTNTSYVFKPNTRYYIYINRSWYVGGYHHYASNDSGWGSASITFSNELSYTLNIDIGENTTVQVERTSSPVGGAATGVLSNGATIYHNDVLKVTFGASEGYDLSTHTVNGTTFESGGAITVTSNVSVASTASIKSYALSVNVGAGATTVVTRTNSPIANASIGVLKNGDTIYYNDVLTVVTNFNDGYIAGTQFINDVPFESGLVHTVKSKVSIVVTAFIKKIIKWICHIDNGSNFIKHKCYIDNESNYSSYLCHIYDGTDW